MPLDGLFASRYRSNGRIETDDVKGDEVVDFSEDTGIGYRMLATPKGVPGQMDMTAKRVSGSIRVCASAVNRMWTVRGVSVERETTMRNNNLICWLWWARRDLAQSQTTEANGDNPSSRA